MLLHAETLYVGKVRQRWNRGQHPSKFLMNQDPITSHGLEFLTHVKDMAPSLLGSPIQQSISIHHEALFFGGVHSVTELLYDLDVTEVDHVGLGRVVGGEDWLDDEGSEERRVLAAVLAVGGSAGGFDERVVVGELLEDDHGGEDVVGFARPTDLQIQARLKGSALHFIY
ncbi:hypothetical protein VNO77_27526 [Canavalia gladiata]|uniref:Uncharacterized protein n=1 Tax=Canavalia gladiata TaxID=3824 RepID=A0AAN9QAK9_CANGL